MKKLNICLKNDFICELNTTLLNDNEWYWAIIKAVDVKQYKDKDYKTCIINFEVYDSDVDSNGNEVTIPIEKKEYYPLTANNTRLLNIIESYYVVHEGSADRFNLEDLIGKEVAVLIKNNVTANGLYSNIVNCSFELPEQVEE